jgi:hypothetical protein
MTRSMRAVRRVIGPLLVIWIVAGCTTATASPDPSSTPAPTPSATVATPSMPSPSSVAPDPTGDRPPDARLAAEGGDPVAGQLGSYTWADGGSDSPWLAGAPVTVGAGEPLSITLIPPVGIASWRARSVPASADGPEGATLLGEGSGPPMFSLPAPGTWTVEVHIVFADGAGDASYFWSVEVR